MGTTASSCIQAKMFPIFSVVLLASCLYKVDCQRPPYPPAPPPPPPQGGEGHLREQVRALHREDLLDTEPGDLPTGAVQDCTGVIETNIERVCFNVNELVCNLVEAVHYETLEETYQVQRCFTGKDRVCDTTYDIDTTTKDDYQCCNVETPNCYMEEK